MTLVGDIILSLTSEPLIHSTDTECLPRSTAVSIVGDKDGVVASFPHVKNMS